MATVGFEDLEKLKVPELRKLCKEHGIASTGKKDELVARLKEALQEADENILEESGEGDSVPESTVADDVGEDLLNEDIDVPKPKPAEKKQLAKQVSSSKENGEPAEKKPKVVSTPITPPAEAKVTNIPKSLSDHYKLALRAQKFGLGSDEARKAARAQRFGISATNTSSSTGASSAPKLSTAGTAVDVEKLKQRAERFGMVTSKALSVADKDDKLQKRKERFGVVTTDDKLKKRQERFGAVTFSGATAAGVKSTNLAEEEAKRKRAERFGLNK